MFRPEPLMKACCPDSSKYCTRLKGNDLLYHSAEAARAVYRPRNLKSLSNGFVVMAYYINTMPGQPACTPKVLA